MNHDDAIRLMATEKMIEEIKSRQKNEKQSKVATTVTHPRTPFVDLETKR